MTVYFEAEHVLSSGAIIKHERNPGIEMINIRGGPGYEDERLILSNGVINGLRVEIENDDMDGLACFNIESKEVAMWIVRHLTEWCDRIADPLGSADR